MYELNLKSMLQYRLDMRHCRGLLRAGSHSFHAASLVLPRDYRSPITALYAFCRVADDEIDASDVRSDALDSLYRRLDLIYADLPRDCPVDRAFADVVHRYAIPRTLPEALLEGFAWDTSGRRYETLSDLYGYAARVAGTVGAMMALLMGVRKPDVISRACDLGVAMQLTNIARDVGEDARAGRLYLPQSMLRSRGIDPDAWLANPEAGPAIAHVVSEMLGVADRLYSQAAWGISQLPMGCRPGMFAAKAIYAEIGREVERNGYDCISQRAYVSTRRKLELLAQALRDTVVTADAEPAPVLREARFLLDAVGTR